MLNKNFYRSLTVNDNKEFLKNFLNLDFYNEGVISDQKDLYNYRINNINNWEKKNLIKKQEFYKLVENYKKRSYKILAKSKKSTFIQELSKREIVLQLFVRRKSNFLNVFSLGKKTGYKNLLFYSYRQFADGKSKKKRKSDFIVDYLVEKVIKFLIKNSINKIFLFLKIDVDNKVISIVNKINEAKIKIDLIANVIPRPHHIGTRKKKRRRV
jgi:hypothetical protein